MKLWSSGQDIRLRCERSLVQILAPPFSISFFLHKTLSEVKFSIIQYLNKVLYAKTFKTTGFCSKKYLLQLFGRTFDILFRKLEFKVANLVMCHISVSNFCDLITFKNFSKLMLKLLMKALFCL